MRLNPYLVLVTYQILTWMRNNPQARIGKEKQRRTEVQFVSVTASVSVASLLIDAAEWM